MADSVTSVSTGTAKHSGSGPDKAAAAALLSPAALDAKRRIALEEARVEADRKAHSAQSASHDKKALEAARLALEAAKAAGAEGAALSVTA